MKTKRNKGRVRETISFRSMLLLLVVLLPCSLFAQGSSFLSDDKNTSYYVSESKNFTSLKWKYKTGGMIFSSLSVSDSSVFFGSHDSCLYALDAETGTLRWKFKTNGVIPSTPAIKDTVVYVLSMDANLYAIGVESGAELWHFTTGGEHQRMELGLYGYPPADEYGADPWDLFLSSPLVVDSLVYIGSSDSNLYAINTETGLLQWKSQTGQAVHSKPAYADGKLVCTSWDNVIYAFNAATGSALWEFETTIPSNPLYTGIQASPSISDGIVYTCTRNRMVYAINLADGSENWSRVKGNSWLPSSLAIDDEHIYFGSSIGNGTISSVNKTNGETVYQARTGNVLFGSPTVTDNYLYEGAFNGRLYGIEKQSGEIKWEFQPSHAVKNYRNFSHIDGTLDESPYVGDFNFNSVEGQAGAVGELLKQGSILSTPSIANDMLYFSSTDSCVYAIEGTTATVNEINLGSIDGDDIVNFNIDVSVSSGEYDSVTIAVKSNSGAIQNAFHFEPSVFIPEAGVNNTIEVALNAQNLASSLTSIVLYLDYWQQGNRNRLLAPVNLELSSPPVGLQNSQHQSGLAFNCYPTVFTDQLTIAYTLEKGSFVHLSLLNSAGMEIQKLEADYKEAGEYVLQHPLQLPQGIYMVQMITTEGQRLMKVMRAEQ